MPVSYDGNKLIPAPFVEISKEYIKTGDGKKVGSTFNVTLQGTMVPSKGSPNSKGGFQRRHGDKPAENIRSDEIQFALFKKTEAIRDLFSTEGKLLKINTWHDPSGSQQDRYYPGISGYARITSINFGGNGQYIGPTPYTINLQLDDLMGMGLGVDGDDYRGQERNEIHRFGSEDYRNANINIIVESGESFSTQYQAPDSYNIDNFTRGERLFLSNVSENWQADRAQETSGSGEYPMFNLTHTVSAVGKRAYNANGLIKPAWEQAKGWVIPRLGIPSGVHTEHPVDSVEVGVLFSGALPGFDLTDNTSLAHRAYNHTYSQQINSTDGSYSVTETWLLGRADSKKSPLKATEDINFETQYDWATDRFTVTVNGTITGIEQRKITRPGRDGGNDLIKSKFESANDRYRALLTTADGDGDGDADNDVLGPSADGKRIYGSYLWRQAKYYSGVSDLHPVPATDTVSKNPKTGQITFSATFDDRPQTIKQLEENDAGQLVEIDDTFTDAKKLLQSISENVSISFTDPTQQMAQVQVPGRSTGPVIQNLGTITVPSVTIQIDVQMPRKLVTDTDHPDYISYTLLRASVEEKLLAYRQDAITADIIWITSDTESWDPILGAYNRSVTWSYQANCGGQNTPL